MLTNASIVRAALSTLVAVTLGGLSLADQTRRGAGSPSLDLGAGVDLVTVDAVVLDRSGQPVLGLKPEDFVVRDEGVPQAIENFEAVVLPQSGPGATTPETMERDPSASTPTEATPTPRGRLVTVVFDDVHLTQASAARAREIIRDFLDRGLASGDQILVTSTGSTAAWSARVPEGLVDLRRFLDRLEGHRSTRHPMDMTEDEARRIALHGDRGILSEVFVRLCVQGLVGNQVRCKQDLEKLDKGFPIDSNNVEDAFAAGAAAGRTAIMAEAQARQQAARAGRIATLSHLNRIISATGPRGGRKVVFMVSEGFLDDLELREWHSVLDAARRSNTVLHFIDPRTDTGFDTISGADVMQEVHRKLAGDFYDRLPLDSQGGATLAYATGGSVVRNPGVAADQMGKILDRSRVYYLLGFEPLHQKLDGKFHKLEVAVRRPGVKVIAREGYYAPDASTRQTSTVGRRLLRAVDSPRDSDAVPLRLATYVLGPAPEGRTALLVAAEVDGSALVTPEGGKPAHQHLDWALVARPREGGPPVALEWPMDLDLPANALEYFGSHGLPAYRNVELAPGTYQLRVAVDQGGRVGSTTQTLDVPEPEVLRISTPILSDSARPAADHRPPQPIPVAHNVFSANSTLLCLYGVYGAKIDPATGGPHVAVSFDVGREGEDPVIKRPPVELQPAEDGSLAETVPLVLRGAAPGRYEMSIKVKDLVSGGVVEQREPFIVR
jgi:VWFA-related protein